MAANTYDVRSAVQQLAGALLDDVERIVGLSVARMQELLPSYANVPAEALIPVLLTNTRNLLEAVRDPQADHRHADQHFRLSGETRRGQGITADEMLQAWRIGLEVVREEAHPIAKRLELSDAVLLEFVEAILLWGDVGMRRSATAHREGEIRELEQLAAEQAALRRVATMVAREATPEQVFALVTDELSHVLDVNLVWTVRFESDGSATVLATRGRAAARMPPGTNIRLLAGGVLDQVLRTGRPARLDEYARLSGLNDAALFEQLREDGLSGGAGGPIVVEGRIWGAMLTASPTAETLPPGIEDRIAQFAELVSTAISNVESRARVRRLGAEQAALRRVAELIAAQPPPEQVFALVTRELSHFLDVKWVRTVRFEPDGSATILAARDAVENANLAGTNVPVPTGSVVEQVFRTARPARVDYTETLSPIGGMEAARCGAAGPIVVDGRLWGAMVVGAEMAESLPSGSEDGVARFAELVSTAISNVESRAKVEQLAAEQAALRRVAELVARQAPADQVFAVVTEELSRVLGVELMVRTARFEPDGTATILAARGVPGDLLPAGINVPRPGGGILDQVLRTGRPGRVDDYTDVRGPVAVDVRDHGIGSAAAGPIVVDGRIWGAMAVGSREGLPPGIEHRVAQFAELVSTAISNIESRAKVDRLVAEQAALRRVAEFVAAQPPSEQVFALVTEELSHLLEVSIVGTLRFEPDGSATILAVLSTAEPLVPGTVVPPSGGVLDQILDTGRPARVDDFEQVGAPTDALMRQIGVRCAAGGPIVVDGLLWGAMVVASETANALPAGAEDRVAQFAELVSTAISNVESRAKVEQLAGEQAALRRVATLVAEGAAPSRVFDAVRAEVEQMFGGPNTILMRFDPDGMATLLATPGNYLAAVGTQWPLEGDDSAVARVYGTGHAARADYTAGAVGPLAEAARLGGTLFPVAVPVVVDGALWGAMSVGSRGPDPPPSDLEGRLAKFTELLATAIANAESRADLAASEALARELASEQAALRRVATIVAEGASPGELFSALAEEVGVLLDVDAASILRYETDSTTTVIAGWSDGAIQLPLGERLPLDGDNLAAEVLRTGKPRRKNDYVGAPGRIAATVRELGVHSAVASPIVVEGAIWGVVGVLSRKPEPLPSDTEARLAEFSRHAGIAVANAKSRSDLAESRARIVRAGDEARRRFERDLHDGAQQRLVSLGLGLRAAEASIPPELHDLRRVLSGVGTGLTEVLDDLRELSRGLHPAVLSEDGLDPALRSLALRSAVPVELRIDLDNERFEAPVEAAAYYVASEALTNVAKHADASRAQVRVSRCEGWLDLVVSDDGSGGADASSGSGLTGLLDRVEAIGGTIQIESPRDAGTAIHVRLPIGSTR